MEEKPLVSIKCLVYNHEPYLRECLDGFVMQKTSFKFEAIVHDDASTDGSADIIREYAAKYPDIIKPIYEIENQYSKHDGSLRKIMNRALQGKYIAFCEGDDYWIDPLKLQKQVDFLENNQEYSLCSTNYKRYNQNNHCFLKGNNKRSADFDFDQNTNFKRWVTKTLTVMYRNDFYPLTLKKIPNFRDFHIFYIVLMHGKGRYLDDITGVYRIHDGGVQSSANSLKKARIDYLVSKEILTLDSNSLIVKEYFKRKRIKYFLLLLISKSNDNTFSKKKLVKVFLFKKPFKEQIDTILISLKMILDAAYSFFKRVVNFILRKLSF